MEKPFIEKALKEMFKRVGAEYSEGKCKQGGWYLDHSWTEEQERAFKRYLIRQFRHDMSYLKLYKPKYKRKKLQTLAGMFLLNYGWKNESHRN